MDRPQGVSLDQPGRPGSPGPDHQRYGLFPFDIDGINRALHADGYVYGAGYGMYLKPTFFLGRARSVAAIEGHTIHTADRELVRDLFTAPAMLREHSIFLRLEPLKALLWDKFTELRPDRGPALTDAFGAYGITPGQPFGDDFTRRFEQMVLNYSGVLLRHELAESKEAVPQWKELLTQAGDRNTEHFLRAVKDLVADTSDTRAVPKHRGETRPGGRLVCPSG